MRLSMEYLVKLQEMQTRRATMRADIEHFKYETKHLNLSENELD